jgi:glycosyltransferase involved in cell wall biosynthesis
MKILILQDHLRSGGTERQSILLGNAFVAAGHAVTLLTFRPGGALAGTVAPVVNRLALQSFDTGLDWYAPGLSRVLETLRPEVILCMGRMANCYGGSIVRIIRDRWPDSFVIATMRTGKQLPWPYRLSLRRARHIIANSEAARSNLVTGLGLSPDRISVIYNPLVFAPSAVPDAPGASAARTALRSAHGAGPGTTVLLDVAMFRPEKNQRQLIMTAAGLPAGFDWQLWLAGDGPARIACEQLAGRLNVSDRVRFLGYQADPAGLFAAADLAVHASVSESLSNFLIEAQAQGLPAIAYDAQGISECMLPGDTGAVIPRGAPEAFRTAILRFARADAACRNRAREFARRTFAAPRQVQAHLDLFAKLAKV